MFLKKGNEYFEISEKISFFKILPRGKQIFYYFSTADNMYSTTKKNLDVLPAGKTR